MKERERDLIMILYTAVKQQRLLHHEEKSKVKIPITRIFYVYFTSPAEIKFAGL